MKLHYLRERHGGRVATFATATPIANSSPRPTSCSASCSPDVLDAAGLTDFDTWAATFGEVTTDARAGPGRRPASGCSRGSPSSATSPSCCACGTSVADIKTADDLQPAHPGAAPAAAPRPSWCRPARGTARRSWPSLVERGPTRSRPGPCRPEEDNMLRVATHGRMAALDLRLLPDPSSRRGPDAGGRRPGRGQAGRGRRPDRRHLSRQRRPDLPRPRPGPARCSWCSATWAPRTGKRSGNAYASCGSCSSTGACRPGRSGSSTRPATTRRRASCSPPPAPGGSRS